MTDVAVVIATKDRVALLERLLDALGRQEAAPAFEVVVVDDGSKDATSDRVGETAETLPFKLRVLRQGESTGPAGARNRGWRATTAPLIVFTDDDCVPEPAWLRELATTVAGADLAAGVTTYPEDQADRRGTWSYWMEDDGNSGHFSTCNVAYRRDVLEAVGGFDEDGFRYRRHGRAAARCVNGEDTDLAWRAIEAGFRPAVASGAVVRHEVFPSNWRAYLRNVRRLEGIVLLIKKHPQLRAHFGVEWVYRTGDAAALAVLAGLAGMTSRRLRPLAALGTIAAVTWYVRLFRRFRIPPTGPGGHLVAVPLGFVADAYAALVMLRASIRHRTVLL
ncbi:MAG TPA: glycosyltransferase [Acidimicrobiia bacterium]|nr:glycosyltransferase [Acidimicrobiia bacterium]